MLKKIEDSNDYNNYLQFILLFIWFNLNCYSDKREFSSTSLLGLFELWASSWPMESLTLTCGLLVRLRWINWFTLSWLSSHASAASSLPRHLSLPSQCEGAQFAASLPQWHCGRTSREPRRPSTRWNLLPLRPLSHGSWDLDRALT